MEKIKRIDEIDILKGVGIVIMITGHIGFGSIYDKWIHSFHMPMFFIISGFLFNNKNISILTFIKKKARGLLIPYFAFSIIHYFCWLILCFLLHDISINNVIDPLFHIFFINTSGMPIAGALWFLTSLFISEVIYFILLKYLPTNKRLFLIFLLSIFGCIIPKFTRLPFAADTSLMAIGLFEIGYKMKKSKYINSIKYKSISLLFIIFASIICFINGYVNVRNGEYSNIILYYLSSTMMTIGLFYICKFYIYNIYLKDFLKFIGKNSIVYVCLNQIVLFVPNAILTRFTNIYYLFFAKLLTLFFSMIILHCFVFLINRYCKCVLGKI